LLAPMSYFSMVSQRPVCGVTTPLAAPGTDRQSNRALYGRCAECGHHFSDYRAQLRFCSDDCRARYFRPRGRQRWLRQRLGEGAAA
jgi:hypothetical protein